MRPYKIFAGNSNPELAREICAYIGTELGDAKVGAFSDGEIRVEINESVRGADVYVIQSTCAPVNHNLMELLIMLDACKRASAGSISAVVPYFGYARQDRKAAPRAPISARLVTDLITAAGADRIITMELHAGQIQGFFNGPVDHLYSSPVLLEHLASLNLHNPVIVSPDAGGVERARAYAKRLNGSLAIIDKRRAAPNVAEVMNIIGEVEGRTCVLVDDMVDTAGTLCQAAAALKDHGAKRVVAYATHAVLSGPAVDRLSASVVDELVVTDTIPLSAPAIASGRIRQLSVAELLGETMRRIGLDESVSSLYVD
jgi:ribose-phosphate pyrophosphokinase